VTIDRNDQGDEAGRGKEDVTNALAGLAKYIGKTKLNLLAACQQMLTILARQSGEQTIVPGGDRDGCNTKLSTPLCCSGNPDVTG
jgi:hypothetical protein